MDTAMDYSDTPSAGAFDGRGPAPPPTPPPDSDADADGDVSMEQAAHEGHSNKTNGPIAVQEVEPFIDLTQATLHDAHDLHDLFLEYGNNCSNPDAEPGQQLELAKLLAVKLLQFYYPANQGFTIGDADFSKMLGTSGWLIELKPTKDSRGRIVHPPNYHPTLAPVEYRTIPREYIAGYVVNKTDSNGKQRIHTTLGIMMDNLLTLPRWKSLDDPSLVNHCGDILAHTLGWCGEIDKGYGFLILGSWLNFYAYDADGNADGQKKRKGMAKFVWPLTRDMSWNCDINAMGMANVERMMREVVRRSVEYQDGAEVDGVRLE